MEGTNVNRSEVIAYVLGVVFMGLGCALIVKADAPWYIEVFAFAIILNVGQWLLHAWKAIEKKRQIEQTNTEEA